MASTFKNITSAVPQTNNQLYQNHYQKSFFSTGKTYSSSSNSLDFKNDDVRKFLDQEKIKYNESRHCNDYVIGKKNAFKQA